MNVMVRKRPIRSADDLPDWMKELRGFASITGQASSSTAAASEWHLSLALPADLSEVDIDPILILCGLALGAEQLDQKIEEVARFCRGAGSSWTQIGAALGVSKQAAWEQFSGED